MGDLEFYNFSVCSRGPLAKPGSVSECSLMAGFALNTDVAFLFPFINAVVEKAALSDNPPFIRFSFQDHACVLHPEKGLATSFVDRSEALTFVEKLIAFLNDLSSRLDEIQPKHRVFRRVSVIEILKLLPKNDCGECGFPTCIAFAARLSQQETSPELCRRMGFPIAEQVIYPVYDERGNLRSTVTIEIDMARREPRESSRQVESLKYQLEQLPSTIDTGAMKEIGSLPQPLTPREMQVLRLIAHGATNPEISQLLKISPHTVKSHVIHIFNKLGINDRTQAAVWAAQHDLL